MPYGFRNALLDSISGGTVRERWYRDRAPLTASKIFVCESISTAGKREKAEINEDN